MTIAVRMLRHDDLARLGAAHASLAAGIDARAAAALLDDPSRHAAVALDGACIVGLALARRDAGTGALVVADVAVAPSHRRRGVGRRLLQTLLDHGRALGYGAATVEADRDDVAARRLCAAAGGVEVPEPRVRVAFPLG
jgi:ribosomal protein S18 acetylase RimI-like enzyme